MSVTREDIKAVPQRRRAGALGDKPKRAPLPVGEPVPISTMVRADPTLELDPVLDEILAKRSGGASGEDLFAFIRSLGIEPDDHLKTLLEKRARTKIDG